MVMELDRIRQKVWAGEALSTEELSLLRGAVGSEEGPSLRTTVGQALLNADQPREALPILEAVRRDYPRDVQTHLALARAHLGLERWAEAEPLLRRALELNPGDPEALKALVVCAMRRGEWERARALIDEALKADLLDVEAQQLFEELKRCAPAELLRSPSVSEYLTALLAALKARSTPHLMQRNQLIVRLGGQSGVARLDVDALYADFIASGRSVDEVVTAVAQELAERAVGLPGSRLELLAKALPVLRDSAFLERAVGAACREGPGSLWVFYAVDDPELVRYVPDGLLGSARVSLEQLDDAAWKNLALKLTEVRAIEIDQGTLRLSPTPTGLWCLAHGDGHDAARLLVPEQLRRIEERAGPSPWRLYLGLRELVLLCSEADAASVKRLESLSAGSDGIAGLFRYGVQGKLEAL